LEITAFTRFTLDLELGRLRTVVVLFSLSFVRSGVNDVRDPRFPTNSPCPDKSARNPDKSGSGLFSGFATFVHFDSEFDSDPDFDLPDSNIPNSTPI
jgi:hypothetical protein